MRPIKLTIQGFTSFAETAEIDFSDLDLFAITGPTGSGKTSVLDAMTWALYGCTPRLGKCGSELISHGGNIVKVCFEFAAGMNRYRVARTAKRAGAGQARLEKWRQDAWIPDDAAGVKETSAAISKLVGLDFDAFKLAVILPQGEFDRFLRGDHAQRRKILKSLLGLEVYDRMARIAFQKSESIKAREVAEQAVIDRDFADATEDHLKALTVELQQQKKALKENDRHLHHAEQLCGLANRIAGDRTARAAKETQRTQVESDYLKASAGAKNRAEEAERLEQKLDAVEREHDSIIIDEARAAELFALTARADHVTDLLARRKHGHQKLQRDEADLAAIELKREQFRRAATDAEASRHAAEDSLHQAQQKLDALHKGGSVDLLEKLADDLDGLAEMQKQAASIEREKEKVRRCEQELQARIAELGPLREAADAALSSAKKHETELTRHAIHRDLRFGLKKGEPCPVCEQPVSAFPKLPAAGELEQAWQHVQQCEAELRRCRESTVRADTDLRSIPTKLSDLNARGSEIAAAIHRIRERVHVFTGVLDDQACAEALVSRIEEIRAAEQHLKQARDRATTVAQTARKAMQTAAEVETSVMELKARVSGLVNELGGLSREIERIQPDIDGAGGADRIIAGLKSIEAARERKAKLASEARTLRETVNAARQQEKSAEQQAAILGERMRSLTADVEALDRSLADLEPKWKTDSCDWDLPKGGSEVQRATLWLDQLRGAHDGLQQSITRLETGIAGTKEKITRLAELKASVEALRQQYELYDQLRNALRADRFIDHLLSRAYDDLCSRGSEHLLRLSGERYSFSAGKNAFFIKDAWNGDAERPAGTLSGGESFFASLALALALADSVASFSADGSEIARLEALFLDEGVSTLDQDEALPAVIDALMNLQADNRMIGVISHMENLAHRLPARIEIVKNHGRSSVRVEGYSPAEIPGVAQIGLAS